MMENGNEYLESDEVKMARQLAERVIKRLCQKWKLQFMEDKLKWDRNPGWPAKYVETTFKLYGQKFSLGPTDIGLTSDAWDQGFMETVQGFMEKDLREAGATEIQSFGFID